MKHLKLQYQELYKRLVEGVLPSPRHLWLLLLLVLTENILALLPPWFAGQLSQVLIGEPSYFQFECRQLLFLLFFIVCFQAVLNFTNRYFSATTSEKIIMKMRQRLYDHLQRLPIVYHHRSKHGETLSLLSYDISVIGNFLSTSLVNLLPHLLTALGALLCIFTIKPLMAVFATLLLPLFVISTKLLGRQVRGVSKELMEQYADTFAIVEENLATLPLIKAYTTERAELSRFSKGSLKLYALTKTYLKIQGRLGPATKVLSTAMVLGAIGFLATDVQEGSLQPGELISLLLYGMLLAKPVTSLAEVYGQFQRCQAAAHRLNSVLAIPAEPLGDSIVHSASGSIVFDQVTFSFPDRPPLFKNLTLTIESGSTVAIIGENGIGKSTLAHLLLRLYCPEQGAITIGNVDISTINLNRLRSKIGLVQQLVLLRNSSIRDNLLYGQEGLSEEALNEVCQSVGLLGFIGCLPDGLDTIVGDKGVSLSGGQRQKVALARALLKDPEILILDEATAMFDPEAELSFIDQCRGVLAGRTVILITHRQAILALADTVLELTRDGIVEVEDKASPCDPT